jgi:hypothetical protein
LQKSINDQIKRLYAASENVVTTAKEYTPSQKVRKTYALFSQQFYNEDDVIRSRNPVKMYAAGSATKNIQLRDPNWQFDLMRRMVG